MSDTSGRSIGVIGTTARALVGVGIIAATVAWEGIRWWDVSGALVVLPVVALGAAIAVNAALSGSVLKTRSRVPWSVPQIVAAAALIVLVILVGTALTFVTPLNGGSIPLFFGASMLLASALGYDGCEMLALPNVVPGRRDSIWCPLYTPLDRTDQARPTQPNRP